MADICGMVNAIELHRSMDTHPQVALFAISAIDTIQAAFLASRLLVGALLTEAVLTEAVCETEFLPPHADRHWARYASARSGWAAALGRDRCSARSPGGRPQRRRRTL